MLTRSKIICCSIMLTKFQKPSTEPIHDKAALIIEGGKIFSFFVYFILISIYKRRFEIPGIDSLGGVGRADFGVKTYGAVRFFFFSFFFIFFSILKP